LNPHAGHRGVSSRVSCHSSHRRHCTRVGGCHSQAVTGAGSVISVSRAGAWTRPSRRHATATLRARRAQACEMLPLLARCSRCRTDHQLEEAAMHGVRVGGLHVVSIVVRCVRHTRRCGSRRVSQSRTAHRSAWQRPGPGSTTTHRPLASHS
jgi:hypothetical protein